MPTRLRVDLAGYHHVINRGVNRSNVCNHPDDKEVFLQIVNKTATLHKVTLHNCLMDNHYHLLIEMQKENISTFMRLINANYAKVEIHSQGCSFLDTVIVIPLSTVIEPNAMPYRFHITSRDKLEKNSDACIYEIRALSKIRIKEKLSKLTVNEIITVQKCLCEIAG